MTNVTIGNGVTNIAAQAFFSGNLIAINVETNNPAYSSVDGVLFDKNQTTLIEYPAGRVGSYSIPNSVTSIGVDAFYFCTSLTSVTIPNSVISIGQGAFGFCVSLTAVSIPNSVTSIGQGAFEECDGLGSVTIGNSVTNIGSSAFIDCFNLAGVYFQGNAPSVGSTVIYNGTAYYLPGTAGWGSSFGAISTALWLPQLQATDTTFGVRTNQFGFNVTWAEGKSVVVEASPSLSNPVWTPVATNTLSGGSFYFTDPQWTNYPSRFYRVRWQ